MEDMNIIQLYHQRNQQAITETASKYGRLLYTIAKEILQNHEDSEETVNDSYGGAWNAMPPQRPRILPAFLSRITRNLAISRYRKHHAQKRTGILVELSDLEPSRVQTEEEVMTQELSASIEVFLRQLPKEERVLFLKRYFFAQSLQDLAEEAQSSVNQISGRLYRIRQKLKRKLEGEGYII